jgi:hypothetical protein
MNTSAQNGRGLRGSQGILGLIGALGAFGAGGPKVTAIGPSGKAVDLDNEEEFKAFLQNEGIDGEVAVDVEGIPNTVERDGQEFPLSYNYPLAGILGQTSPFNGIPSLPYGSGKSASTPSNPLGALAGLAALTALLGASDNTQQGGPDYRIPRHRGPRRLPWEPSPRGCGNPDCPIHGTRRVPSTPDDRGAVLTLSGAIEVEADYSEDPRAKDWIAWVRANYSVGYVRCGKCGAVTRVRYWNEFDLHDCTRKLPCLRRGALHTQVTVDGDPDNE